MKNTLMIIVAALVLITAGCSKQGPVGPSGNANVKMYLYGEDSLSLAHDFYKNIPLSQGVIDSSIVLAYYDPNGNWYSSPGLGAGANYQTRTYTNPGTDSVPFTMSITNADGGNYTGTTVILNRVKILVIPASVVYNHKTSPVDFNDYKATMKYFGLKP